MMTITELNAMARETNKLDIQTFDFTQYGEPHVLWETAFNEFLTDSVCSFTRAHQIAGKAQEIEDTRYAFKGYRLDINYRQDNSGRWIYTQADNGCGIKNVDTYLKKIYSFGNGSTREGVNNDHNTGKKTGISRINPSNNNWFEASRTAIDTTGYIVTAPFSEKLNKLTPEKWLFDEWANTFLSVEVEEYIPVEELKDKISRLLMHAINAGLEVKFNGDDLHAFVPSKSVKTFTERIEDVFVDFYVYELDEKSGIPRTQENGGVYFQKDYMNIGFDGLCTVKNGKEYYKRGISHQRFDKYAIFVHFRSGDTQFKLPLNNNKSVLFWEKKPQLRAKISEFVTPIIKETVTESKYEKSRVEMLEESNDLWLPIRQVQLGNKNRRMDIAVFKYSSKDARDAAKEIRDALPRNKDGYWNITKEMANRLVRIEEVKKPKTIVTGGSGLGQLNEYYFILTEFYGASKRLEKVLYGGTLDDYAKAFAREHHINVIPVC